MPSSTIMPPSTEKSTPIPSVWRCTTEPISPNWPPLSSFVGYLKGKSSLMIYEQFPNLKYKYRNREFWCRGYYVDTVGKNAKKIEEYIRNQLEEDRMGEQLTMGNF